MTDIFSKILLPDKKNGVLTKILGTSLDILICKQGAILSSLDDTIKA
jgi:hypothetical protein